MKSELAPNKKLDFILKYLNHNKQVLETHNEIKKSLTLAVDDKDLELMLNKLLINKFIFFKYTINTSGGHKKRG